MHEKAKKHLHTIRSRWPLASETTFVLWTLARLAPLNLPRVSVSSPKGNSTLKRVVQHPSCLQRCLGALSSNSRSPTFVYECKWVWESGVFFRDLCMRRSI
ncbi:hypothetical protein CEXT_305431 [Caerostris extrusa]|uniref:Uncharacterized protein n=1 Tax=Caerostris extrusa TaxID=172846 RepID=A0AAV4P9M8_CAEEX|nr:hypothetical protein CEXT_305431 [Caerostris extrusa]